MFAVKETVEKQDPTGQNARSLTLALEERKVVNRVSCHVDTGYIGLLTQTGLSGAFKHAVPKTTTCYFRESS